MDFIKLLNLAIQKAEKQDNLAVVLDLAPSALSKRINGEVGWQDKEINALLKYTGCDIENGTTREKIETLKEAMKILLFEES